MALYMDLKHPDGTEGLPPDAGGTAVSWSAWHWMRLMDAMMEEQDIAPETPMAPPDHYEFMARHQFVEAERNIWRGEVDDQDYVFTIHAGTVWTCWRNR